MICATVMCVDAHAAIRALYIRLLCGHGYHVLALADGRDALALFQTRSVNIAAVILDNKMPGMNGLALATSLKAMEPSLPILMIATSPPAIEDLVPFVDVTIEKGVPVYQVLARLKSLITLGRQATLPEPPDRARSASYRLLLFDD
jgi:CheY-like chemotaxis protein